jgi:hypothetical protein
MVISFRVVYLFLNAELKDSMRVGNLSLRKGLRYVALLLAFLSIPCLMSLSAASKVTQGKLEAFRNEFAFTTLCFFSLAITSALVSRLVKKALRYTPIDESLLTIKEHAITVIQVFILVSFLSV